MCTLPYGPFVTFFIFTFVQVRRQWCVCVRVCTGKPRVYVFLTPSSRTCHKWGDIKLSCSSVYVWQSKKRRTNGIIIKKQLSIRRTWTEAKLYERFWLSENETKEFIYFIYFFRCNVFVIPNHCKVACKLKCKTAVKGNTSFQWGITLHVRSQKEEFSKVMNVNIKWCHTEEMKMKRCAAGNSNSRNDCVDWLHMQHYCIGMSAQWDKGVC